MSDGLKTFSDAMSGIARRREVERAEFNERLGEPAVFLPDPDDSRFGVGYWKADGGVISYRRYANGFNPNTRMEFSADLIHLLNRVMEGQS